MYEYVLKTVFLRHVQELINMFQRTVYATHRSKSHKVELLAGLLYIVVCSLDLSVLKEFVFAACDIYLDKVLIHNASGAKVEVTHLGVSHLSVRKAHIFSAGLESAHRVLLAESLDVRRALSVDDI